jgi:nitrite reductase/ring-hydroxylating ferredoxin subunit
MPDWHKACKFADLEEGKPRSEWLAEKPIALVKVADRCYAFSDICTHEFALLSEGWQEADTIVCPMHQARFRVTDGKCMEGPAEEDLKVLESRVSEDGLIYVLIPDEMT